MKNQRWRPFLYIFLGILLGGSGIVIWRSGKADAYGAAAARCPGPDQYGYHCATGGGFAYINADRDTMLYADEGVVEIDLPFPFQFYGNQYEKIWASSNGTLHFSPLIPDYNNHCLDNGAVAELGEMIAPFWDDLNSLQTGFIEYVVVGDAPDRIFVIEWERVPLYESGQPVTFAVQLFENGHDLLFLYGDGDWGSGTGTIGIQSASQDIALTYGCNVPVPAAGLHIIHPERVNPELSRTDLRKVQQAVATAASTTTLYPSAVKGEAAELLRSLNRGHADLALWQQRWQLDGWQSRWQPFEWPAGASPQRAGIGLVRYQADTEQSWAELWLYLPGQDGRYQLQLATPIGSRTEPSGIPEWVVTTDLDGDQLPELLLHEPLSGRLLLIQPAVHLEWALVELAAGCNGPVRTHQMRIVLDGCDDGRRFIRYEEGRWQSDSK